MKKTTLIGSLLLFVLPAVAAAQTAGGNLGNIVPLVQGVGYIVSLLIPILIGVAVIVFFYGLVRYIMSSGEGHKEGRNIMLAGIISLFIMVSIWGIIFFAQEAIGINHANLPLNGPNIQGLPSH